MAAGHRTEVPPRLSAAHTGLIFLKPRQKSKIGDTSRGARGRCGSCCPARPPCPGARQAPPTWSSSSCAYCPPPQWGRQVPSAAWHTGRAGGGGRPWRARAAVPPRLPPPSPAPAPPHVFSTPQATNLHVWQPRAGQGTGGSGHWQQRPQRATETCLKAETGGGWCLPAHLELWVAAPHRQGAATCPEDPAKLGQSRSPRPSQPSWEVH